MPPPDSVPVRPISLLSFTVGIVTLLMTALAGGAVWSLLVLSTGRDLSVLSLAVGLVLGAMLRLQGLGGRAWSAPLAALLTALASVYAAYFTATADVAVVLGLPMRATLPKIGAEMALAVAWARTSNADLCLLAIACVLSAWIAVRKPRA
jgi:hypothetical protein